MNINTYQKKEDFLYYRLEIRLIIVFNNFFRLGFQYKHACIEKNLKIIRKIISMPIWANIKKNNIEKEKKLNFYTEKRKDYQRKSFHISVENFPPFFAHSL